MDATKIVNSAGCTVVYKDPFGKEIREEISDAVAVRNAVAEALRELADEIELGHRIVTDLQSCEAVTGTTGYSSMFMKSELRRRA